MRYFRPEPGQQVHAVPGEGLDVPIWILGSSTYGAQLAAILGLPYAFASHFAPAMLLPAIEIYRQRFRPSAQLAAPHVMLGVTCVAAETDAEARFLFSSLQQNTLRNRTGQRGRVPPPIENFEESLDPYARAIVADALGAAVVGGPETVREGLDEFVRVTGANELMITARSSTTKSASARSRSSPRCMAAMAPSRGRARAGRSGLNGDGAAFGASRRAARPRAGRRRVRPAVRRCRGRGGCIDADSSTPLAAHLNGGKHDGRARRRCVEADLIVCEGGPARRCEQRECDPDTLRRINPAAALVLISPFGQTGPQADDPASDLTLFFASGIARLLTGQVDDLDEAPIRPVGEQSAFIGGIAAACAGMHAVMASADEPGAVIDVSIQEALATLAMTELARAGTTGRSWSRKRLADGNGATVCILPARDGYAAISPREDHQWAAWLAAMGSPEWGRDPRFAHQARSGRELGCAARADVRLEPAARQAVDRRYGAAGARAELSAARGRRTARLAAARASRVLARGRRSAAGRSRRRARRSG